MAGPVITTLLTPNPASGSQTADGLEDTLASATAASGTFLLKVDTANMADGDILELRAYTKARSTDTERQVAYISLANAQSDPLAFLGPIATDADIKFTLKQTAGTNRAYPWAVLNLNGT